jgi:predicted Na+-dependent transporter
MTRNAGGNVESATAEVVVGNVIGTFLTPSLLTLYLKPLQSSGFIQPDASGGGGLVGIYTQMAKQLSASLLAPLVSLDHIVGTLGFLSLSGCWPGAPESFTCKSKTDTRAIQI